jgi:hypothetical protein
MGQAFCLLPVSRSNYQPMNHSPQEFTQSVRNQIYAFFVDQARPPTVAEAAMALQAPADQVSEAFLRLGAAHAILLERNTPQPEVRMAWPFSAVPTPFLVSVGKKTYYANCAWDMFGIPAALHADAAMEARCADCQERIDLRVSGQRIYGEEALAHFLLPFRDWYTNLVYT